MATFTYQEYQDAQEAHDEMSTSNPFYDLMQRSKPEDYYFSIQEHVCLALMITPKVVWDNTNEPDYFFEEFSLLDFVSKNFFDFLKGHTGIEDHGDTTFLFDMNGVYGDVYDLDGNFRDSEEHSKAIEKLRQLFVKNGFTEIADVYAE